MLYVATAILACIAAFFIMHLWHLRPGIPLYYVRGGDELVMLAWTKAIIDDGWYFTITHLGAPLGMSFGDFPIPNLLHMTVLRILTIVIHNPATALNLYFLAGFPIIAVTSAYVLRRFGLSWATASCLSIIYAMLPTRFMRNEAHLFYAQYYLAPVLVLAVVWVARGHALFDRTTKRPTRDGWIYLAGLLAVSWDNEYFAIFGMSFLFVAAVASAVRARHVAGALAGVAGILVLFAGIEVELMPYTIYEHQHGTDAAAIVRPPQASEIYALTLAQLVLPIQSHRIQGLAAKRAFFDSGLPLLINENSSASLGALGALGFLGSLGALLLLRRPNEDDLWPSLAKLNLAAFLLTTLGGVGALVSYFYVPELRAYNRVSPIIGFVSLAVVGLVLEVIRRRWLARVTLDRAWYAGLVVVMALAILDQTSADYVPDYAADRAVFLGENAYAVALEQRLPPAAAIYQVPHVLFPEGPPVEQLGSWDQAALYLHSHRLRYSFGATRGRSMDAWEQQTDARSPHAFVSQVMLAGFDGVAEYRSGYADGGVAESAALSAVVGAPPFVRDDGSIMFFDLSGLRAQYVAQVGSARAAGVAEAIIAPSVSMAFGDGFYGLESSAGQQWDWAPAHASILLTNTSDVEQPVRLRLLVSPATSGPAHMIMRAPSGRITTNAIARDGSWLVYEFNAPPGNSHVTLETDARRLHVAGDARDLRFQLHDWSIAGHDTAAAADIVDRILAHSATLAVPQLGVDFGAGCYQQESDASRTWHWCTNTGNVLLQNASRMPLHARLRYELITGAPSDVVVTAEGSRPTTLHGSPAGTAIDQVVVVPPGTTTMHFVTNAQPVISPGDARHMVFQLVNVRVDASKVGGLRP